MPSEQTTIVGILFGGLGVVSGVVTVLWKKLQTFEEKQDKQHVQTLVDLEECRKDRQDLHERVAVLKEQVSALEEANGGSPPLPRHS